MSRPDSHEPGTGPTDRIQTALMTAFECHRGQTRKLGGAPYTVHILDVARLLLSEPGVSDDVVVAGILHDTLEDTSYTPQQLERDFGPHVLSLVQFATEPDKDHSTSKEQRRRTWRARKEHTITACAHASRDQLLVLLADKLSNLASLREELHLYGETIWTAFNASQEDIAWYYRALRATLAEKLQDTRLFRLYARLADTVFEG
jgi:(p)ppGpp synthase/HD superfamily hydrolase